MITTEILNILIEEKEFFMRKARYGAAIILLLSFILLAPLVKGQTKQAVNANELIFLTNQERLKNNLPTLSANYLLNKAATNKAKAIIEEQFFSHNLPEGGKFSNWVKDVDYKYTIIGENLATGFNANQVVIEAWMNSPAHKENILSQNYKEIGLAVIKGRLENKNTYVIVQYLGVTNNFLISENLLLNTQRFS